MLAHQVMIGNKIHVDTRKAVKPVYSCDADLKRPAVDALAGMKAILTAFGVAPGPVVQVTSNALARTFATQTPSGHAQRNMDVVNRFGIDVMMLLVDEVLPFWRAQTFMSQSMLVQEQVDVFDH